MTTKEEIEKNEWNEPVGIYFTPRDYKPSDCNQEYDPYGYDPELVMPTMNIVTRQAWGALPNEDKVALPVVHPVKLIMLPLTRTKSCRNPRECLPIIKQLQEEHVSEGFNDILYNFLIAGDGRIYEGRGWHTSGILLTDDGKELTDKKLDIAYIGTFEEAPDKMPPQFMQDLAYWFIELGKSNHFIDRECNTIDVDEEREGDDSIKQWCELEAEDM